MGGMNAHMRAYRPLRWWWFSLLIAAYVALSVLFAYGLAAFLASLPT